MKIRVAGAQLPVTKNIASNTAAILRAIDFAEKQKADILLTPEGSLSGYVYKPNMKAVGKALKRVTARAKAASVGLAVGTCFIEPKDKKCYNQIRFYTPDGRYVGFYAKTLVCGTMDVPPEGEINYFATRPLRTFEYLGIRIGGLICNDLWANPEWTPQPDIHLSQKLSRMGARIIFHAVHGYRDASEWSRLTWHYHESNLRMRARAGRLWIVTVDNSHPTHLRCSSPSGVIGPDGNWVRRARQKGEQYFAYTLDLAKRM